MKKKLLAFVIILSILFFGKESFANNVTDFFMVENLPVSATAYSSSEAKKRAINYARQRAFNIVLSRLIKSEDFDDVYMPSDYDIEKFVQALKLNNEKTSSTSYSADIDIKINKNLMHEFLDNQDIKFLKDFPPSTLVVFVNGNSFGFEDKDYGNENVVPFVLFKETDEQRDFIVNSSLSDLSSILSKYNVSNVIIVEENSEGEEIIVSFKDMLFGMVNMFSTTSDDFVKDFVTNVNDSYKLATSDMKLSNKVSMVVPLFNLSDWISFEKKLASINDIKSYNVVALKHNKAQIEIEYNYDIDSVVNEIKKLGFFIEKKIDPTNNNYYLMIER